MTKHQAVSGSWGKATYRFSLEASEQNKNSPADTLTLPSWDWPWSSALHDCEDANFEVV